MGCNKSIEERLNNWTLVVDRSRRPRPGDFVRFPDGTLHRTQSLCNYGNLGEMMVTTTAQKKRFYFGGDLECCDGDDEFFLLKHFRLTNEFMEGTCEASNEDGEKVELKYSSPVWVYDESYFMDPSLW